MPASPTTPALVVLASAASTPAVSAYELTGGRLASIVGAILGLAGAAVVAVVRRRGAAGEGRAPRGLAVAGAALGLAAAATGAAIVALADGGPGSGSGIVGGVLCLAAGLLVVVLAVRGQRPSRERADAARSR